MFLAPHYVGTGKTSHATKWIQAAAEKYGPENVFVTSFTKAAALNISGRGLSGVKAGTLHSHCWNALDRPQIAEKYINSEKDGVTPWNRAYPQFDLSGAKGVDIDNDPFAEPGSGEGDALMSEAQLYRAIRLPLDLWPNPQVAYFYKRWTDWKEQHSLLDFTDLIEVALEEVPYAPGSPAIGFVDEAQDMTPLQMALLRSWAAFMSHIVMYGDDDQILYAWAGCTPKTLMEPTPDNIRILSQSWRVPRKVHALAEQWIRKVKVRQEKEYRPRDEEGHLFRSGATWREPSALIRDAKARIENGQTVMFLASCGYMLWEIINILRDEGIPFHNPYREKQGNWNPLFSTTGLSPAQKLLTFARPNADIHGDEARMWTYRELASWVEPLRAEGVLLHGAKKIISDAKKTPGIVTWEELAAWFTEEALNHLWDMDMHWYSTHVLDKFGKALEFPMTVMRKHGVQALQETPRVVIGTIHSVKGGEADCVYLFPDLSAAGYEGWVGQDRDSIIRLGYVGMTRAKDTLVLASPATGYAWSGM